MGYQESPPRADLTAHVRCIWSFEGDDSAEDQRIAPDGCCELIVHHATPYAERDPSGMLVRQAPAVFAGQITRPLHLRAESRTGVTAVRFRPAGAWAFAGVPLLALTDRRTPLVDLHGQAAVEDLLTKMRAALTREDRLAAAQDYVADRIARHAALRDRLVEACVSRLEASEGRLSLEALAAGAGVSLRQLQRRFARAVGVSPQRLAAVMRLQRVLEALREADAATWTEAAQAAGYFDHPQMARDFRRYVGCTPSQFVAGEGLASALGGVSQSYKPGHGATRHNRGHGPLEPA